MSTSEEVSIQLACDNAAAELLIIDSEFQVVARGSAPLEAKVEPGIYALKAKIGAQVSEQLQIVDDSQPSYYFNLAEPEFESPMPLAKTKTSREYHHGSLAQFAETGGSTIVLGKGSAIILYVRDTSRRNFELKPEQAEQYARNFDGFRLLDAAGVELVNFDAKATRNIEHGYVGARVQVAPGPYVLGWQHDNRETRLALNPAPGWSLHVFVRLQPITGDSLRMEPDFSEAALAYDDINAKYAPEREDFRLMEAARLALLDQRNIVSGDMMRSILTGKYQNPMLGIYGGHMLADAADADLGLLEQVIDNTSALIGPDNPDIVALRWRCESKKEIRSADFNARWQASLANLKGPPLLVQSWDALLACAQSMQVDVGTLPAFSVAGDLVVSGILLTWEHRREIPREETFGQPNAEEPPAAEPEAEPLFASWGKAIWRTVATKVLSRRADGIEAPLPTVEVKVSDIKTPEAAAAAMRLLANKVKWDRWLSLVHKDRAKADSVTTFSPLQRELISTLARATKEPDVVNALDEAYIDSVMRAHRVPLSTIADALRALDVVAVSTEVIERLKFALSTPPSKQLARK